MTQLIIAGVEAVLPQQFSVTVKRENPFFTKSGEYTYDVQLRLDNPVNLGLYGFLNRLNGTSQVPTGRQATLMADGHVYCRGTEVITRWTAETVSIQVVSGESELNFIVGQDRKIEDLPLGSLDDVQSLSELEVVIDDAHYDLFPTQHRTYGESDYCLPTVSAGSVTLNRARHLSYEEPDATGESDYRLYNACPQPYLCALLRRLMSALGYTVGTNHLEQTQFRNLFLVNTVRTVSFAKMVPGWTVKDFLTAVEQLTGCVIITDNTDLTNLRCDIVMKSVYYQDARQLWLRDVIDEYEAEINDDENRDAEFTSSDVSYDMPDNQLTKLMKLPEGFLETATIIEHANLGTLLDEAKQNPKAVHKLANDDRLYILVSRDWRDSQGYIVPCDCLAELDQFRNLDRADNDSTLELKITPAPTGLVVGCKGEAITLSEEQADDDTDTGTDQTAEQSIQNFKKEESQAGHLYCAFFNGFYVDWFNPLPYTDQAHAYWQELLYPNLWTTQGSSAPAPSGSLRLQDLDADYYQGGYQIDTRRAVTFETFDPNRIDVRQVYVVRGRRYVVRDCEETIGPDGRQPLWRVTCYPIDISDEAIEKRWVLTKGVWDDGAAWLDDGRWNDSQN